MEKPAAQNTEHRDLIIDPDLIRKYGIDPDSAHMVGDYVAFDFDPDTYANAVFPKERDEKGSNRQLRRDIKNWFNMENYASRFGDRIFNFAAGNNPPGFIILETIPVSDTEKIQYSRIAFSPSTGTETQPPQYDENNGRFSDPANTKETLEGEGYVRVKYLLVPIAQKEIKAQIQSIVNGFAQAKDQNNNA